VSVVLVRDLALEAWPSMDRYAVALATRLPNPTVPEEWRTLDGPRYLTRYWTYPRRLRRYRAEVVHVLDHSYAHCLRAFPGTPAVVTVHDLLPLRLIADAPRGPRGRVRNGLLRWVLRWLRRADRLVVATHYTARELELFLDVDPDRVRLVPFGVEPHFFERPPEDAVRARRVGWAARLGRSDGPAHVVLHVGSCVPRKNVEAAILAIGSLRARGLDAVLVQLGGEFGASHHDAIRAAGLAAHVMQEPAVAEQALVEAYHAADALVLPSHFEGFGFPAVEAMAAGLPVVASGAGGMREAVGDGGAVTGAVGPDAIAAALFEILTSPARRAELVTRGRARAATLTWDAHAAGVRGVYDELLGR
jgi:glycosyltransferase involved in cell wall biosynthesis